MKYLTPDEIAHLTQGTYPHDKDNCPHQRVVAIDGGGMYICLDCGLESRDKVDFNMK